MSAQAAAAFAAASISRHGYWRAPSITTHLAAPMTGRVVIVTGASSGIGFETARYLCEGGNDVILACRDDEKAKMAIDKIKQENPSALATYIHLDLASLESVRKFVDEFHATGKKLNVLINNAGIALNCKDTKRQYTQDGFELTIGTNHLGPFLLTNLLLDDLKKAGQSEDARVIIVTSTIHDPKACKRTRNLQPIDMEDLLLFKEGSYSGLQAYKNSKAANIMFAYQLSKKLSEAGVEVLAVCPGFVPSTELLRNASGPQKMFSRCVLHGMLRFTRITRSIPQAADYVCSAATDYKYKDVTGKYINEGQEIRSSEETLNEELQATLWELSARYTALDGYEPLAPPPRPVDSPAAPPKQEDNKDKPAEDVKVAPVEVNAPAQHQEEKTDEMKKETDEKKITNGKLEEEDLKEKKIECVEKTEKE